MATAITNIIFDMDGTLINTVFATGPACRMAAEQMGLPTPDPDAVRRAIGFAGLDFHRQFFPYVDTAVLAVYAETVEQMENDIMRKTGAGMLFDGVSALMTALQARGCVLALASTGSPSHVHTAMEAAGLRPLFPVIRCGSPDKAAMVADILSASAAPADAWLMVGDKSGDADAGKRNGLCTVAARYGFGTPDEWARFSLGIDTPTALLPLCDTESDAR